MKGIIALLLFVGCTAAPLQLSPSAEAVRVTSSPDAAKDCESLGLIDSGLPSVGRRLSGEQQAAADAIRRLKQKADALGANTVILLGTGTETGGSGTAIVSYHRASGEAYRCRA